MNVGHPTTLRAPFRTPIETGRPWHAHRGDEVLTALSTRMDGLTREEAAARLGRHGRNELPVAAGRGALRRLADQFRNVLIYVLLAAGVVTLLPGHRLDAGVILAVVLANALIGFVQEGKAERALDAVPSMLASRATVRRRAGEGSERLEIDAAELVPGDIVLLASGDRVPADLRLLRVRNLRIDEAALTGESVPADKSADPAGEDAPLSDRAGMAYSGTVVTWGQATGVVVGTGPRTEIGRIGAMVSGVGTLATPLTRRLDRFARRITAFILAGSAGTFAFGYLVHGFEPAEIFLAVVGLAVSAIPEGLPAIVTITLAIGTQRMARRNAVVPRLPAVENGVALEVNAQPDRLDLDDVACRAAIASGARIAISTDAHGVLEEIGRHDHLYHVLHPPEISDEAYGRHDHLYHVLDPPEISDEAYGRLYDELAASRDRHPAGRGVKTVCLVPDVEAREFAGAGALLRF